KLSPADQFFRGMVLEERGDWDAAQEAFDAAMPDLYTREYLDCWQSQIDYVRNNVAIGSGPIVDLASGRCYLVRDLIQATERPIIATDFSLTVLRRNREWLRHHNLYDHVSLLAFDARRTPFRHASIGTMTTNVGLPNIDEPGNLLQELYRIVSGRILAISHYYAPGDGDNLEALKAYGLERSMLLDPVLTDFRDAGWQAEVRNRCSGRALPTPKGVVLADQGIDAFPIAETTLDWCVIEAS
ncbi:class I SAM-dependent methyltransferase, partial [Candidatus Bipolaricaulota bacterium]|nr:class I SAM-dependent methyltransferase [Candidatus Bipolaricaulota bacterium]